MAILRPHELTPSQFPIPHRALGAYAEVHPLLDLCRRGKLYEVEAWIDSGHPIQFEASADRKLQRRATALGIAVEKGFHSLAALLLANGYNPNGDYRSMLPGVVRKGDVGTAELLLRFGACPQCVDFCEVLESGESGLVDRFIEAGVDPCREDAVARALANPYQRNAQRFVRQYRERFPELQQQVDLALYEAAENSKLRSVAVLLWLGGNPHAEMVRTKRGGRQRLGLTAFESALWCTDGRIIELMLKQPIPRDRLNPLLIESPCHRWPAVVRKLLDQGANPNLREGQGVSVLYIFASIALWDSKRPHGEFQRFVESLELLLKAGARWSDAKPELEYLQRDIQGAGQRNAETVLTLLTQYHAIPGELAESMREARRKRTATRRRR